jgi:ribosomal protein L13
MSIASQRAKKWREDNPSKVKGYESARYHETHKRIKARRKLIKAKGESAVIGMIVEHVVPIKKNGSNSLRNLKIVKATSKKAFHQKKDGKYRR